MILKDFYNNGIYPIEKIVPKDPEYRELGKKTTIHTLCALPAGQQPPPSN